MLNANDYYTGDIAIVCSWLQNVINFFLTKIIKSIICACFVKFLMNSSPAFTAGYEDAGSSSDGFGYPKNGVSGNLGDGFGYPKNEVSGNLKNYKIMAKK